MVQKLHLAADARSASWRCAPRLGQTAAAQWWDHRQSVGHDHGKMGIRGVDAHKRVNGRKRHILVHTLELLLAVVLTAASV